MARNKFLKRLAVTTLTAAMTPDVNGSDYFATAVRWGVANNIIFGITSTTFSPSENCNRGQAVTLIYRAFDRSENDAE